MQGFVLSLRYAQVVANARGKFATATPRKHHHLVIVHVLVPLQRLVMIIILEATTQVPGEEFLCHRIEFESILRPGEAMSFVREEQILVVYALIFHRSDDLFGLSLFHTGVICTLRNEHGYFDLVNLVEGRARAQKFLLGIGVTDSIMKSCQEGRPVGWNRFNQRDEVARADDIDCAAEEVRSECGTHQGGVTTIGATIDGNFMRIGNTLINRPVNSVHEVVVHVTSPLFVSGIKEIFTVSCRAAEVHLQAGITTVSQPLRLWIVAPTVTSPRSTMDIQYHW